MIILYNAVRMIERIGPYIYYIPTERESLAPVPYPYRGRAGHRIRGSPKKRDGVYGVHWFEHAIAVPLPLP